jgi:hypothetical protein
MLRILRMKMLRQSKRSRKNLGRYSTKKLMLGGHNNMDCHEQYTHKRFWAIRNPAPHWFLGRQNFLVVSMSGFDVFPKFIAVFGALDKTQPAQRA